MQIAIEIDEEEYQEISINKGVPYHLSHSIGNAILNGTPLPEHHGDLIDRKELKKKAYIIQDWIGGLSSIVEEFSIDNAPTIIPATKEGAE